MKTLIRAAVTDRDKAILEVLYSTGCRVGELRIRILTAPGGLPNPTASGHQQVADGADSLTSWLTRSASGRRLDKRANLQRKGGVLRGAPSNFFPDRLASGSA